MNTQQEKQHTLRPDLPPLPINMRTLPIDARGYPVPFFVAWVNGVPEFRCADPRKMERARLFSLCWVCGKPLGKRLVAFAVGPMCAVNRISSEPPSHPECAEFSARACPFMTKPQMVRREDNLPGGMVAEECRRKVAGTMIDRNPGATLIWLTRRWEVLAEPKGYLWQMGHCERALWFAKGRAATREEVLESITSGLPILRSYAEIDGEEAVREMETSVEQAMRLVPKPAHPRREFA